MDLQPSPERADDPAQLDAPELRDFMNLRPDRTGVDGVIYVSTREDRHGPRVKVYAGRPGSSQPNLILSIGAEPRRIEPDHPPRELLKIEGDAIAWVKQNALALREFWDSDGCWFKDEVDAFEAGLVPLSR